MLVGCIFGKQSTFSFSVIFFTILIISSGEYTATTASSRDQNTTTNKTGTNETIISLTNRTPRTLTQNQSNPAVEDTRPIIINQNEQNVDWTSIGAVLVSAGFGAFFGSYLQNYFSSRTYRKREHLNDLKEKVAKPLYERITSPDFKIRVVEFQTFKEDEGRKITAENILYHDFMENHYPDIQTSEKGFYESKLAFDNAAHDLRNKLNSTLRPILEEMKTKYTEDENTFYEEWIESLVITIVYSTYDVLVSAIVDRKYDKSFFHIADNDSHRILYFFPVKDDMIPFKLPSDERLQFVIFESKSTNQESNITKTNEVKDKLIQIVDRTLEERDEEIKKYENIKSKYYYSRKKLADSLLTVTYSTKLQFKQSNPNKRCSLT
jgi:hypothetical protein